jgi:hypothetical protein
MLENLPEPNSDNWKNLLTALAAIGATKAWFWGLMSRKLSIKAYEADKKLIALQNKNQLDEALDPICESITEIKINLRHFFEKQGMKYHKKDE